MTVLQQQTAPPMSTSAQTVFWFGVYIAAAAFALFVVPDLFLAALGLPPPTEPWIRVFAVPLFNLGVICMAIGRSGSRPMIRMTAITRSWVILAWGALVATGLAPLVLLVFAAIDLLSAALTFWALRKEALLAA